MKVVLIAVHQLSLGHEVQLHRCLGVLVLAAALKRENIDCEVLDFYGYTLDEAVEREAVLKDVLSRIVASSPDILGFSTMSSNLVLALHMCREVKGLIPSVSTILGGPGVSACAKPVIEHFAQVDAIIRGEAEEAFPRYVHAVERGEKAPNIEGLVCRNGDSVLDYGWPKPIADLDDTPVPLFEVCKPKWSVNAPSLHIEVGRGCPFGCSFCSTSMFFKRRFRVKSVQRVVKEIKAVRKYLGEATIVLNHDLLTYDRRYVLELCDALEELKHKVVWGASVRFDTIDPEILSRMKASGCRDLCLGIEVATSRLQNVINKQLDLDCLDETLGSLIELGFRCSVSFIVGFPEEEDEDLVALWNLVLKMKSMKRDRILVQFHSLSPEPGSQIYEQYKGRLQYDEYGSPSHSDFPALGWEALRSTIREYPEIFPIYYHVGLPPGRRESSLKHTFLGRALQAFATSSMLEAYRLLGNRLAESLVSRVDEVQLPSPEGGTEKYVEMMRSLRALVLDVLSKEGLGSKRYDTAAQLEIALLEIVSRSKESPSAIIRTPYDPIELISQLYEGEQAVPLEERDRYTVFFWDKEKEKVRFFEVADDIANVLLKP